MPKNGRRIFNFDVGGVRLFGVMAVRAVVMVLLGHVVLNWLSLDARFWVCRVPVQC